MVLSFKAFNEICEVLLKVGLSEDDAERVAGDIFDIVKKDYGNDNYDFDQALKEFLEIVGEKEGY